MAFLGSLLPGTPVQIVVSLIGLVFGFLLATSGFDYVGRSDDLGKNARYRNAKLVIFGLVGTLFDWKVLNLGKDENHGLIVAYYLGAVVLGAGTIVAVTSLFILGSTLFAKFGSFRDRFVPATRLLLLYLSFGVRAYLERSQELDRSLVQNEQRFNQLAAANRTLIGLMLGVYHYRTAPNPELRDQLIDSILDSMVLVVKILATDDTDLQLRANFMSARRYDAAEATRLGAGLLFTWGNSARYAHILLLERYAHQGVDRTVALPVDATPLHEATLLPGAPKAFASDFDLINSARPVFKPRIPKEVQKDIKKYFANMNFKSVLSLPLLRGTDRVGVVNIESNRQYLIGESREVLQRVEGFLRPHSMLLGLLV